MATCALACDHGQPAATVTIAPTATASATATATATTTASGAAGASCASNGDCSSGLNCCTTGLSGKCGGAHQANVDYAPCVMLQTCVAGPCTPMPMPPYGGAFPDDASLTV